MILHLADFIMFTLISIYQYFYRIFIRIILVFDQRGKYGAADYSLYNGPCFKFTWNIR